MKRRFVFFKKSHLCGSNDYDLNPEFIYKYNPGIIVVLTDDDVGDIFDSEDEIYETLHRLGITSIDLSDYEESEERE